jgi:hypothetical protein
MSRVVVTSVLAGLLLSGCQGKTDEPPSKPVDSGPPAAQSQTMRPAWTTELDAVGQPVVVGDVGLVIARRKGGALEMVALSTSTGRVKWRKPYASMGRNAERRAMVPRTTRDRHDNELVVFQAGDDNDEDGYRFPVVAVDPATGKPQVSYDGGSIDFVGPCADGRDICLDGPWFLYGSPEDGDLRPGGPPIRLDVDRLRSQPRPGGDGATTVHAGDLYVVQDESGEQLQKIGRKRVEWTRSVRDIFGARASSGRGWNFSHFEDAEVYAGSIGIGGPEALAKRFGKGKPVDVRMEDFLQLRGIAADGGEVTWLIRGGDLNCALVTTADEAVPVTCLVTGSQVEQDGKEIVRKKDFSVAVAGFDPASGETTWTVELSERAVNTYYDQDRHALAPQGVVVETAEGFVGVDFSTGKRTPVSEDTTLFCVDHHQPVDTQYGERKGDGVYYACRPDTKPVRSSLSAWGVDALAGDRWKLASLKGKVVGFDVNEG